MNKRLLTLAVAAGVALIGSAHAADLIPVFADDPNEGYNDTTPLAPAGGNPGTTKGEQRRLAAQFAADLWGAVLVSDVPIYIGANFTPLAPNVLGSAGATQIYRDPTAFPVPNVWYSAALADALVGEDILPGYTDINSNFSSDYNFYYGFDGVAPAGQLSFLDVVMHEFGHGLGFQNFENEATGAFQSGFPDIYSVFTYDNSTNKFWPAMTQAERAASGINYGNVVFTGASASAGAQLILGDRIALRIQSPASIAREMAYGTASFGPPATTANFHGTVVSALDEANAAGPTVNDGCTPFTNASAVAGNIALVDRGTCGFIVKAANAQAAGATGLLVANNVAGAPGPGLGGSDPTITIPALGITQPDGAAIRSVTGADVAFVVDPSKRQGADDLGRPRLFMPNPVQGGSSGSHYDTATSPNTLMEPAINDSLNAALNIDITANLLKDTGWHLNTGNALIAGCDTGIKVINDAGIIIGANVQATSNLLARTSPDKATYQSRMEEYKDRMVAGGLITGKQGGRMMQCAAKIVKNSKL